MLSQQELADRAGVSLFTIQRIERGEGSVRPKTGRAVARALSVHVEALLPKLQAPLPLNYAGAGQTDEAVYGLVQALNEFLYEAQQACAPGRELDWSRETLEEISALIAKAAVAVTPVALGAGFDARVEAVQVLARADEVVRLLDARAAEAPAETGPPPEDELQMRRKARKNSEELRRSAHEHEEQRAG